MPTNLSRADIQHKAVFGSTKGLGILLHNFHCKEVGLILNVHVCFSNSYVSEIDQQLLQKVNTVEIFFILGPPMKGRARDILTYRILTLELYQASINIRNNIFNCKPTNYN